MDKEIENEERMEENPFMEEGEWSAAEEEQVRKLVQMQHRRKQASCPDLDEAWNAFRQANMEQPSSPERRKFTVWHLSAAVVIGAAAMLALVFLFHDSFYSPTAKDEPSGVVALQYNEAPREVQLEEEGATHSLTQSDSISFQTAAPSVVIAKAAPAPKPKRLSTPRGMDFKVVLPDGSEVWLNAESTIEFPSAFLSGERRVTLQGEAYFKVAHNEQSPFIVTSNQMSVRVLGTEFNFKSYASELAHVALVEGKVEVMRPDGAEAEATLEPGKEAWYDGNGQIQVQDVDVYAVTQWVKGFFYFHDQPLVDVLRELGRWYNLGVVFHNAEAMRYKVHFSALRNENIEMALESLNRLRRVRVQIEDNNIVVY